MKNYIIIKSGILKAYEFDDKFIKENEKLFNEFCNIWDELYNNNCCVWGAYETHRDNEKLKNKICDILEKMYNLGVIIENGFTDEIYNNFKDIKNYILDYGKEE